MAMKLFASLALFVVSTEVFGKHCSKQADCEEGECCLKRWPMSSSRCERRRAENQSCVRLIPTTVFGDVHVFHCPCRKGFRCKFHQSKGKLETLFFSPKCVVPVKPIPEEPRVTSDDGSDSEPEIPVIVNGILPIEGGIVMSELDERAGFGKTEPGLEEKDGEVQGAGTDLQGKVEGRKPDLEKKDEDESKDVESDLEDKDDDDEKKDAESGVEKEDDDESLNKEPGLEEKVKDTTQDSEKKVGNEGTTPPSDEKDVELVTEFIMGMPDLADESSEREVNDDELPAIIPDVGE